ncbi:HEAT repeat domain-containing protein [Thermogemmatispora tikiterensis]|uniref:HEAT repeat domain-containing protein n=1 Tax=Thermogemmatispora tikiterensis TaxID=1825093 RepID=A0A328VUM8_9CHLR|nr:HEAT repeat domain-containing protein [Thermogemmatispora tikiterensis]RAQ97795.1 hypothetical protein A4R35_19805 [Thermogemmatispora tikiterensis]
MYQNSAEPCTGPLRAKELLPQPHDSLRRSLRPVHQPAIRPLHLVPTGGDGQALTTDTEAHAVHPLTDSEAEAGEEDPQQDAVAGTAQGAAALLRSLPEDGEALVSKLAQALEQRTGLPRGPLLLALAHSSWRVRAEAARLLGLSGEPLIELLLTILEREAHEGVREAIVWSLGRLIPTFLADEQLCSAWLARLRATLIALLQADDCWLVREAAAWALGRLGRAAPLEALRQALLNDGDEEVCAAAAQALALSGKRLARAYLLEALEKIEMPFLQETIREALSELNEALARAELQAKARQTPRTDSPLRQILLALRDFLEDRRGSLEEPRLLLTEKGPVLILWCSYQAKERRLQEVLNALSLDERTRTSIAPLEAAQCSGDGTLRLLGQRLVQHCRKEASCQEVLMLSTTICHQAQVKPAPPEQGCTCLRVIIIGVSKSQVDGDKPPVLRELARAWQATTQEAPLCEQDPCDLHLWYQPCHGQAGQG